jgi:threonine/homoserine/homoserine lactone efflux protein
MAGMTLAHLGTFALASLVIVAVPGPSVMFIVGQAFSRGRRTAAVTVFGNAVGAYLQVVLVAFGIGLLVERSLAVFDVMKLLGAAYLVCIGVRAFLRRGSVQTDLAAESALSTPAALRQGLLIGASNPKTIVFFTALLPSFVVRGAGAVPAQLLLLGLVYVVIALMGDSAWGLAAGSVREWFGRSPRRLRVVGGAGGLAIIGVGISLAVSGRKD